MKQKSDRIYIEKGNRTRLSDVSFFTFEPHISVPGSKYGYLQEEGNCHLYEKLGYYRTGHTEKINDVMTLVFYRKD